MNIFKTAILLAFMTALFGAAGFLLGGEQGMFYALVFAAVMNTWSWWFSDKMILKLYGAKPLQSGPVFDMTADLIRSTNLPMPKVCIIENRQPNAFATGRNPDHGTVAVTSGIMQLLNERELRGVIAHELAHIQNRDTLTMTITATIAGAISMLANFAMFFGGSRDRPANAIAILAVAILAPLAASLVQMAISRTREYAADRLGAHICGDPLALASALEKLQNAAKRIDNHVAEKNPATAHMFIINPLHIFKVDNLFSTHPATANRIKALEDMAAEIERGGSIMAESPHERMRSLRPGRSGRSNPWER